MLVEKQLAAIPTKFHPQIKTLNSLVQSSVGRVVASDPRAPRFKASNRQILY